MFDIRYLLLYSFFSDQTGYPLAGGCRYYGDPKKAFTLFRHCGSSSL
ncbi:hypothetical protein D1AOALGA4SA_7221 [Olavius algarvensis Delta 1 endosymbiont]|nr:hypothetical protein D1AOALGA4SA_7221 [Olavius algarvensis Delta 1 endosymbiont]